MKQLVIIVYTICANLFNSRVLSILLFYSSLGAKQNCPHTKSRDKTGKSIFIITFPCKNCQTELARSTTSSKSSFNDLVFSISREKMDELNLSEIGNIVINFQASTSCLLVEKRLNKSFSKFGEYENILQFNNSRKMTANASFKNLLS